ncbi:PREDICTED: nucleolar protein 58-like [Polistes dominula]|uniref:Nucleolar protein 58-like n=1 Tax=Polistes dominula TaxID=743375 RepID=A0ABM1JBB6_POLDO|nr:PREDICTED: nucleolar protein 58-like [Polistes dominula]
MTDISKDEVRREATAILKDADLITMLTEKVKKRIEKKLDVNLTARREEVDDLVIECLQEKQDGEKKRNKAANEGSDDRKDEEEEDSEEKEREEEKKPARRSPTKKTSSKRKEDSSASKESVSDSDIDED